MTPRPALLVAVAAALCPAALAQGAQMAGGRPPRQVERDLCEIGDVFGKLSMIKSNSACTAGCAQGTGVCPPDWYPSAK